MSNLLPAGEYEDIRQVMIADYIKAKRGEAKEPIVQECWAQLAHEVGEQYAAIKRGYQVTSVDVSDSYPDADMMFADIMRGRIFVSNSNHPDLFPFWTPQVNRQFRVVHDIRGHFAARSDFSFAGEVDAYIMQAREHSPLARHALWVEVVGQSAMVTTVGSFAVQKAYLSRAYNRFADFLLPLL